MDLAKTKADSRASGLTRRPRDADGPESKPYGSDYSAPAYERERTDDGPRPGGYYGGGSRGGSYGGGSYGGGSYGDSYGGGSVAAPASGSYGGAASEGSYGAGGSGGSGSYGAGSYAAGTSSTSTSAGGAGYGGAAYGASSTGYSPSPAGYSNTSSSGGGGGYVPGSYAPGPAASGSYGRLPDIGVGEGPGKDVCKAFPPVAELTAVGVWGSGLQAGHRPHGRSLCGERSRQWIHATRTAARCTVLRVEMTATSPTQEVQLLFPLAGLQGMGLLLRLLSEARAVDTMAASEPQRTNREVPRRTKREVGENAAQA